MFTLYQLDPQLRSKVKLSINFIIVWYLLICFYNVVGHLSILFQNPAIPATFLDKHIPFISEFVYAYILMFFLPIATILFSWCKDISRRELKIFYWSQLALLLSCYFFYLLVPTTAESIQFDLTSLPIGVNTLLIHYLYEWGVPLNAFPSYHVAPLTLTAFFIYEKCDGKLIFALPFLLMPMLATVFIKYHFVLDIFGGLIFGAIAYYLFFRAVLPNFVKR